MTLDFFTTNISTPATLIPEILKENRSFFEWKSFFEYNPEEHKINDTSIRKDKVIIVPIPGAAEVNGIKPVERKTVPVARLAVPLQKLIVSRTSAFVTGGGVTLKAKPVKDEETTFEKLQEVWNENKMDYQNQRIVKAMLSETEAAEIWYTKKYTDNSFELKCNVFSPSQGDSLIPVFDNYRDLIAFARAWQNKEANDVVVYYLDVYTADELHHYYRSNGSEWDYIEAEPVVKLTFGKIPVIYYCQLQNAWKDVQPLIERFETLISNFADTNDYNGSPILGAKGVINGWMDKGEQGKMVQMENDADLKYISWDSMPESIKFEAETLLKMIFMCVQMPNLTPEEMAGLGSLSGAAYDRVMTDAHLKARDIQNGSYGEGIQRRCNLLVSAISNLYPECNGGSKLNVVPHFGLFKVDDDRDKVEIAVKAYAGKVWDLKTAVTYTGVDDPQAVMDAIEATPNQAGDAVQ